MKNINLILSLILFLNLTGFAQESGRLVVTTGASFLAVNPDARGSSLGASGVASAPDLNSQFWNAAKYQFLDSQTGIGLSYTPWLRSVFNDMYIASLSGFHKIGTDQAVSGSLRYYSGGMVEFQELNSSNVTEVKPYEFSFDGAYIRQLSPYLSASITFRYIHSDLKLNQSSGSDGYHTGHSFATDLGLYSSRPIYLDSVATRLTYGFQISNIGGKISYSDEMSYFLPTLFRAGINLQKEFIRKHTFCFGLEMSKFMVPSRTSESDTEKSTQDISYSVVGGMVRSLYDSPDGLKGELREMNWSLSVEYNFQQQFYLRTGYFMEHPQNGNRKFLSAGLGLSLKRYLVDFSYIFPTERYHPLANTLQISIGKRF